MGLFQQVRMEPKAYLAKNNTLKKSKKPGHQNTRHLKNEDTNKSSGSVEEYPLVG